MFFNNNSRFYNDLNVLSSAISISEGSLHLTDDSVLNNSCFRM